MMESKMSESISTMMSALQKQLDDLRREVESLKPQEVTKKLGMPCDSRRRIYYSLCGNGSISRCQDNGEGLDDKLFTEGNYFDSLEDAQAYKDRLTEWKGSVERVHKSLPINVRVLFCLLPSGWVAMDKRGCWYWYEKKPIRKYSRWEAIEGDYHTLSAFNLELAENWETSLMECGL